MKTGIDWGKASPVRISTFKTSEITELESDATPSASGENMSCTDAYRTTDAVLDSIEVVATIRAGLAASINIDDKKASRTTCSSSPAAGLANSCSTLAAGRLADASALSSTAVKNDGEDPETAADLSRCSKTLKFVSESATAAVTGDIVSVCFSVKPHREVIDLTSFGPDLAISFDQEILKEFSIAVESVLDAMPFNTVPDLRTFVNTPGRKWYKTFNTATENFWHVMQKHKNSSRNFTFNARDGSKVSFYPENLLCLMPDVFINDAVISAFLRLLCKATGSTYGGKRIPISGATIGFPETQGYALTCKRKFLVFDPQFYSLLVDHEFDRVAHWYEKDESGATIFDYKNIVIPINKKRTHWFLAQLLMEERVIRIFDSLTCNKRKLLAYKNQLVNYLARMYALENGGSKYPEKDAWEIDIIKQTPKQVFNDCGAFMSLFADYLLHNLDPKTLLNDEAQVKYMRQRMLCTILNASFLY